MMLLIGAPVLIDDPVARRFVEQAQYLSGVMGRILAAMGGPTDVATVPIDRLDDAMQQLQNAARPLLQQLSPSILDSFQRIGQAAEG